MPASTGELLAAFREFLAQLQEEAVRDFAAGIDWSMPARALEPYPLRCLRHLERAAEVAPGDAAPLARLLSGSRMSLHWGQTYSANDFGPDFLDNYGWVEIFGTRGHFANATVAGGFLLLGPQTAYPDHHHIAEEIYVPLTGGALWRMGSTPLTPRAAGEVIHHRPNVIHAMKTLNKPLLALYLWRGGPLAQRSSILGAG